MSQVFLTIFTLAWAQVRNLKVSGALADLRDKRKQNPLAATYTSRDYLPRGAPFSDSSFQTSAFGCAEQIGALLLHCTLFSASGSRRARVTGAA